MRGLRVRMLLWTVAYPAFVCVEVEIDVWDQQIPVNQACVNVAIMRLALE